MSSSAAACKWGDRTFVLLDPVSGLELTQVRRRVSQGKRWTFRETQQFLKLPRWNPLLIGHLRQTGEGVENGLGDKTQNRRQVGGDTVLLYYTWLHLISRNIRTNLNTVITDRIEGPKEEVLLNPCPVLVGVSKWRENKYINTRLDPFVWLWLFRSHPVLCMASAWFRQARITVDIPLNSSAPSSAWNPAKLQTLFRASRAYRRTLKLWLKHHCRMMSSALRKCRAFNKQGETSRWRCKHNIV